MANRDSWFAWFSFNDDQPMRIFKALYAHERYESFLQHDAKYHDLFTPFDVGFVE